MGRGSRGFGSFVDAVEVRLMPAPYTEVLLLLCYLGLLRGQPLPASQGAGGCSGKRTEGIAALEDPKGGAAARAAPPPKYPDGCEEIGLLYLLWGSNPGSKQDHQRLLTD